MRVLRLSSLLAALCVGAVGWGCGSDSTPSDAGGLDAPFTPSDSGPRPDAPGTDAGPRVDSGPAGDCRSGGECDVIDQTSCAVDAGAPRGCYYASPAAGAPPTTSCEVAGTLGDGEACEFANDCRPGFVCSGDVCRAWCCNGDASSCPTGQTCTELPDSNIGVCRGSDACTLVAPQTGCDAGEGCYLFDNDGSLACSEAGPLAEGAACGDMSFDSCLPGMGCFGRMDAGGATVFSCAKFCRIASGTADCPGERMCAGVTGVTLEEGVGICPPAS
jgi:hypothetical protein